MFVLSRDQSESFSFDLAVVVVHIFQLKRSMYIIIYHHHEFTAHLNTDPPFKKKKKKLYRILKILNAYVNGDMLG